MHFNYSTAAFAKKACIASLVLVLLMAGCVNDQELEFNPELDIPPTCSDGLKNQDETAVDCGGACSTFCSDKILAVCKDELSENVVSSAEDERTLHISQVVQSKSYSYYGALEITAYDFELDEEIRIVLSISEFPDGNMKFKVVEDLDTEAEALQAEVTLIPEYGMYRYSYSGTVYLRKETNDKFHIEFCDLILETNDYYYGQELYKYQGHFNFLLSDSDY